MLFKMNVNTLLTLKRYVATQKRAARMDLEPITFVHNVGWVNLNTGEKVL